MWCTGVLQTPPLNPNIQSDMQNIFCFFIRFFTAFYYFCTQNKNTLLDMKNNLFLTISLLIAFSCCAQNSIRKVYDNYCRIEIPSKNGNFDCEENGAKLCNVYYVLEETFF